VFWGVAKFSQPVLHHWSAPVSEQELHGRGPAYNKPQHGARTLYTHTKDLDWRDEKWSLNGFWCHLIGAVSARSNLGSPKTTAPTKSVGVNVVRRNVRRRGCTRLTTQMRLIADTNVWYDIAGSRRNPRSLKRDGHTLAATPINSLEIASSLSEHTFDQRRDAARAVINYADEIVLDTETHLAQLWGFDPPDFGIDWMIAFKAIADARNADEVQRGVDDFGANLIRRVNVQLASKWRSYHWEDFMHKVEDAIDAEFPGYKQARLQGRVIHMDHDRAREFEREILSNACWIRIFLATYERALLVVGRPIQMPSREQLSAAAAALHVYVNSYSRYLIKCASTFAPQANDWGDLESFIYLQGNNRLLTRDRRWIDIAREAGSAAMLLDPELL